MPSSSLNDRKWSVSPLNLSSESISIPFAASAIIVPVITVVSCAEITKNAATNTYFAFSTVDAFSGNASNSEINAIALGKNELNNKAINTVNNSNNLTSVTS
jgi:hypothetical protein